MENPSNIQPDQVIVVEGDAGFVPKAEPSDAGKVLGVVNASGDVGWVEASGGQLTQVQADWAETDPAQVSYIDNKPDLSVYATSSAVDTALAGKQDVISDLSDIRSGASAGATAVQPSALDSYATTSAMNTALAGKQDVINDLADIRSGAAAGSTAVQPSQLPSSDELVPSATSGDSGKVLTVDAQGDPAWITPAGGSDVTTANGSFRLGGSVPVKVNYTGSQEYERGSLQLVNTFSDGTYAVAVFEVVGAHSIYYETYGDATVTISEAMDIAGTGNSDFAISFLQSDSYWNMDGQIYRDSFTRTDGKIVAQSLRFWSISQYSTGPYLGVGVKVTNDPNESEKIDAVVQQLANGAVSISDWPSEQITVTTIPNIPAPTSADANKVLTVDSNGDAGWQNPATVTVDQHYNASSSHAQSGVAVAQAIAAIPAAPVEVVTNQNSFELEGDNPVKVEFTRVEDTSVIIHTTVDLTPGSPVDGDDNQTMVIAFDLDAVNKAVDDDGPVLKINTALPANSGLSQFQWGFNDSVSTSDNYSNYIQAGSNTSYGFPSGEIDLCNPGTIGTRSYSRTRGIESNTKRYFIVKAVFTSTYKSAISTWMSNGNITIKDWPTEGYGNKVVIPNIPASTSADASKVLTVGNDGTTSWQTPAAVTVDQHYSASSTNAQSGTAVAEALGSSSTLAAGNGVTLTESSGTLTIAADVDNVTIGFDSTTHKIKSLQTVPSVDQTYNSASTNAQSGTAVAQAIAAIPSSSYTAGVGIDITSDVISADIDGVTIKQATTQSTLQSVYDIERSPSSGYGVIQLDSEVSSKFTMDPEVRPQMITIHIPGNTFRRLGSGDVTSSTNVYPEIGDATQEFGTDSHASLYPTPLEIVYNSTDGYTYIAEQDVVVSRFMGYWVNRNSMDPARGGKYYFGFAESQTPQVSNQLYVTANGSDSIVSPVVMSETVTSNQIAVAVPVPAFSQADSGKVLKVNASGNAEWGTDGFTTTAGITDIQKVNALPANPVATVLYLIPET